MLENSPVVVIGGGHAGIEAAFAVSRLGVPCVLISVDKGSIGRLSCNPAIGGLAKTHLVKEIDALGGVMGLAADACALQYKTLNKTKGRAVWSTRVQVDKKKYPSYVQALIKKNKLISVVENEVVGFGVKKKNIKHVILKNKKKIVCSAVVVACGTFVDGLIHVGGSSFKAGRFGEKNVVDIGAHLRSAGHSFIRLKTGTPPRISLKSINLKLATEALGDEEYFSFSMHTKNKKIKQEPCYLVNTNQGVHDTINKNLQLSAMFSGKIKGVGPRYCPSIEDKVFRFPDRASHHLFLEPEWKNSNQIYINGFSTSLPRKVQEVALKNIDALKDVEFIRPGYAIEYNVVPPRELKSSLESKKLSGLFLAGQINGTSGYEEAAAQGLVAGINAAKKTLNLPAMVLPRHLSYIGVLVDDLVTSLLDEPYRMFTSRAEHRLFLRPDNCYSRLFSIAKKHKVLTTKQQTKMQTYADTLRGVFQFIKETKINTKNKKSFPLYKYLKRPDVSFWSCIKNKRFLKKEFLELAVFEAETTIKYEGYIQNEMERIEKNSALEKMNIPLSIDYNSIAGLSNESKERLGSVSPETLGQASRIFGIRPTDITLLGYHIQSKCFT